jgi:hypothetical protein
MSHQGTTSTHYTHAHKKGVSQTTTDYERELARDQIKRDEVYSFPRVKLHLAEKPKFRELVELPRRNCDLGPLHQLASGKHTHVLNTSVEQEPHSQQLATGHYPEPTESNPPPSQSP